MSTQINVNKKIAILDEGVQLTPDVNQIDFTGGGITATSVGNNVTVSVVAASGVFGISDINGAYTYYATLTLAMAAATSGDTIELFADVIETGAVSIILKNGVNINGNGHSYTLDTATTTNVLTDNGIAVNCNFYNIRFFSINTTGTTYVLDITGQSKINGNNSTQFISNLKSGVLINNTQAIVENIFAAGASRGVIVSTGLLLSSFVEGFNVGGVIGILTGVGGRAEHCVAKITGASGTAAIYNDGNIFDCKGYSQSGAIRGGNIYRCLGVSTGGPGIFAASLVVDSTAFSSGGTGIDACAQIYNSTGYSTSNFGIRITSQSARNSTGFSSVNNGIASIASGGGGSFIWKCLAISNAAAAISQANNNTAFGTSEIFDTTAISNWNNASGHAINISGTTNIANCTMRVTNTSANCLFAASAINVKYANNAFNISTVPVNANITQGVTNTHDNQGNILI